jgi:hypothetical protein
MLKKKKKLVTSRRRQHHVVQSNVGIWRHAGFVRTKRFKPNEIYFQTLKRSLPRVLRARRIAANNERSVKSALHFGFVNSLMSLQICVVEVRAGWRTCEDR